MDAPVSDVASASPLPPLRPYLERYTGYRLEGFPPGVHRGLPSRHLTFILSLGDPVAVTAMPDPGHPPVALTAFVAGLADGAATIVHDGTQHGISLDLTPLGARALLGVPAGELAGMCVGLDDVLGSPARELVDRLASVEGWPARFAELDRFLLARLGRRALPPPGPGLMTAWSRVVASGGAVGIGRLAADLGWSRRHLGERFRAEFGLTPKVAARVVRFERARWLLARSDRPPLAEVAVRAGYYDQAHLNRDWRELAGCTPTVWLAEELPPVRDPGG
jgi:AraC-like DNA-binding protein